MDWPGREKEEQGTVYVPKPMELPYSAPHSLRHLHLAMPCLSPPPGWRKLTSDMFIRHDGFLLVRETEREWLGEIVPLDPPEWAVYLAGDRHRYTTVMRRVAGSWTSLGAQPYTYLDPWSAMWSINRDYSKSAFDLQKPWRYSRAFGSEYYSRDDGISVTTKCYIDRVGDRYEPVTQPVIAYNGCPVKVFNIDDSFDCWLPYLRAAEKEYPYPWSPPSKLGMILKEEEHGEDPPIRSPYTKYQKAATTGTAGWDYLKNTINRDDVEIRVSFDMTFVAAAVTRTEDHREPNVGTAIFNPRGLSND
jgi:hypothetical protein